MNPVDFKGSNIDLVKPANMTDEQCYGMRAEKGVDENNFHYFKVAYMPNVDDLKALNEGRPLFLKVLGTKFAPVSLFTFDENGNGNWD